MGSESRVRGEDWPPLLEQTIGAALEDAARRYGGRPALVSCPQNVRWSWKELNARSDALAAGLGRLATGLARLDVALGDGKGTIFTRLGDWFAYLCLLVVAVLALTGSRSQVAVKTTSSDAAASA